METATTPFDLVGGADGVGRLVNRFYDLVDTDPAYADLRAMHPGPLDKVRTSLTGYMVGWLGGPRDWFESGGCVMTMHRPLDIAGNTTEQWIDAMNRAIGEQEFGHPKIGGKMAETLAQMARGMINR
jgi:hemoglobin